MKRKDTRRNRKATPAKRTTRAQLVFRPAEVRGVVWNPPRGGRDWRTDSTWHEAAVRSAAVSIARDAIEELSTAPVGDKGSSAHPTVAAMALREAALLCDVLRFLGDEPEAGARS